MKRLTLLLAILGCSNDPTKVSLKLTDYKDVAIVSLDGVASDLMTNPPPEVKADCAAVLWAACEAAMPGVVRIGTAYQVQYGPDGKSLEWAKCRNVLCVKTAMEAE